MNVDRENVFLVDLEKIQLELMDDDKYDDDDDEDELEFHLVLLSKKI